MLDALQIVKNLVNWFDKMNPPNDPMVRAAMEQRSHTDETLITKVWNNSVLDPPPSRLYAARDHLEARTALHDEVQAVRDAVAEWWASAEHRDHVNPNVVAAALESQERERGRDLDDLLAAMDVELLPWQRDTLGRWLERKLTFRMR